MNVWTVSIIKMLLSHFTVFYCMSCLDISEWKAVLTKPTVCKMFMIDVLNNCKHNAKCIHFLFVHSSLVVLRSQALQKNFDLCLSDTVGISQ